MTMDHSGPQISLPLVRRHTFTVDGFGRGNAGKKDPDFRFCNIILVLVLISVIIISLDYRLGLTVAVH